MNTTKVIANKLKVPQEFFDAARDLFDKYVWENKTQRIESTSEKRNYTVDKRLTKNSRLSFYGGHRYCVWVAATSKRIEVQTYLVTQEIVKGKETISYQLYNFEQLTKDSHIKLKYGYQGSWEKGLHNLSMWSGAYGDDALFFDSLGSITKKFKKYQGFKYLDWENIVSHRFILPTSLIKGMAYLNKYAYLIEYAQKMGMKGMLDDLLSNIMIGYHYPARRIDMRRVNMRFLKRNRQYFQNSNKTYADWKYSHDFKERYGQEVVGLSHYYYRIDDFEKERPKDVKPIRFANWVVKNQVSSYDYKDYKHALEELAVPFVHDRVVMPKDFQKAHDDATKQVAYVRNAKKQKRYEEERLSELLKAETVINDYRFVVPRDLVELSDEGKALHHCVGSYAQRQASGTSSIFFVRDKTDDETPLYTLELGNGDIRQLRADHNGQVPENVWEEARAFKSYVDSLNISY